MPNHAINPADSAAAAFRGAPAPRSITPDDLPRILAKYDKTVKANDALVAVATVTDAETGEIGWEVIQTAEEIGFTVDDDTIDWLFAAAAQYVETLRTYLRLTGQLADANRSS